MKKTAYVVPRTAIREMAPGADLERVLANGWLRIPTKTTESANTRKQRNYRYRRMNEGCRRLDLWLPEPVFNELQARRRKGQSMAETIKRLLELPDASSDDC